MIKSVVRQYRWSPETVDNLYVDNIDYHGLEFWYNDVLEYQKEIEKSTKPKK